MSLQASTLQKPEFARLLFPPAPREYPSSPRQKPSLVIAEDNELLRELMTTVLTEHGFLVRSAADGEAAWQSLFEAPFNLLITDLDMPKLTGLGLVRRMRAYAFYQPIIVVSGSLPKPSPETEALLFPGFLLPKPFSIANLLPQIETLLGPGLEGTGISPNQALDSTRPSGQCHVSKIP